MELGWEKVPNWECMFVHRQQGLFLSVYVDDIRIAGKKQNTVPMWKIMNNVDLDEPTSFLDHVHLGCTQRIFFKPYEISFDEQRKSSNHESLLEQLKLFQGGEKPHAQTVVWSYDMEGQAQKCVEGYCELTNKKTEQLYKVSSLCLDNHHFKKEELQSVGDGSKVCSQIVLKCLYLARKL